ncbi:MAG: DUF167 domain-containing protein [Actinomycetota bacterium]
MTKPWIRPDGAGCVVTVHVQPGAKRTEIVGEHGDALKIRLAAPPVDGKANEALLSFLGDKLEVGRRAVDLKAGAMSRRKLVVADLPADRALALLDIS